MAEKSEFKQRSIPAVMMQSAGIAAALFTLVVSVLLISDYLRLQQMDPLNDPVLLELRQELVDSGGDNEALVEQIRTYDLYARRAFFSSAEQRRTGGWMLLGGAVASFVAFRLARSFMPEKPTVGAHESISHKEMNALFRQMMAATGILIAAIAIFLAFVVKSDLAAVLKAEAVTDAGAAPSSTAPSAPIGLPESFFANWPSLRGPGNIGIAGAGEFPLQWDVESGEGVRWSVEVPVMGFNSPIVWDGRIFLTGADEEGQEVMCFDVQSGEMLWTRTVESSVELPDVSRDTGYAAPTMTTDGSRVFAIFATGELAAFDMDGNSVWQKNIGRPENPYGMGSSLLSDGERLFIQYDHNNEKKVMALNVESGDLMWETPRQHVSWSSPSLIKVNDQLQLILNDNPYVTAYDPVTGRQLWQVECLGGEVAPSPAFNGKDILFVANEYAQATALRLTDGEPEILWQYSDYLPEIPSPLATAERIYIPTTAGDIVCLNAESGEVLWEQEFDDGFNASLICAGNRICAVDLSGVVHIFDDADVYHAVADLPLNEAVYATPALVNNQLIVRGDYNLICLGDQE
ncbi:MAG: PQQ-binding-like beta-propeller repeat protein [Pontiellaceae bacterium]|nr:PQQ-binding-like beta-propeller repeat protein [Pontiellaceae bacterium]